MPRVDTSHLRPMALVAMTLIVVGCSSSAPSTLPATSADASAESAPASGAPPAEAPPSGDTALGVDALDTVGGMVIFEDLDPGPEAPSPATMSVELDDGAATVAVIPQGGGSLSATGADGTTYALEIPATALLTDTEITMTPLDEVTVTDESGDSATWDQAVGVRLEPAGLHLFDAGTLRIDPADASGVDGWGAVSSASSGADAHPHPSSADGDSVLLPITHFSNYVTSDGVEIPPLVEPAVPTGEQGQLEREIARTYDDDGPEASEVTEIRDRYMRSVEDILSRAGSDCGYAESGQLARAAGIVRTLEVTGFAAEGDYGIFQEGVRAAIENCLRDLDRGCFSPQVAAHARRLIALSRMAQLMGATDAEYREMVDRLTRRVNPPGSGLAEAYHVVITEVWEVSHDVGLAADVQKGIDSYVGDIVAVDAGRYCGRFVATSTGTQDGTFLGQECHVTWDGRQTVDVVGRVMDEVPAYMPTPGADSTGSTSGTKIALYLAVPVGGAEWKDADNDCGGAPSPVVGLSYVGEELQGSAIGGVTPRLPAPEDAQTQRDTFVYSGPGIFGPMTWDSEFVITAIGPNEAKMPQPTRGAPIRQGEFAAGIDGGPNAGDYEGSFGDDPANHCSLGVVDELVFSYYDEDREITSVYLTVNDPGRAGTESFDLNIVFGDGQDLEDSLWVSPEQGIGSGSASVEVSEDGATVAVSGETDDGVGIDFTGDCPAVTSLGSQP